MAGLATAAELREFLRQTEEELPEGRADLILEGVSGLIRDYTGRTFEAAGDATERVDGSGTIVLLLPSTPVADVSAVVEDPDGDALELAAGDFEWSADGILRRLDGGRWLRRFRYYEVTYDSGYDTVPDTVKLVTLRVAARAIVNPEGLTQESAGGYAAGYGFDESRFAALAPADRRELEDYRL